MKQPGAIFLFLILLCACKEPEARRPVQGQTDRFIEESVVRNRQLLAQEEARIKAVMKADSLLDYKQSGSGFFYTLTGQSDESGITIEPNDAVTLSYMLATLDNDTIYSADDIGVLRVKVDKEALFPGLREGLKLLRNGDQAIFLFPSALGYGYPGDQDRIGTNVPLRCRVNIIHVEKSQDSIQ